MRGMPALNIEYTEEELEAIRKAAAADGKSVKAYVHDASVREFQRRAFVERGAEFFVEHVDEFDVAFPDDAPDRPSGSAAA